MRLRLDRLRLPVASALTITAWAVFAAAASGQPASTAVVGLGVVALAFALVFGSVRGALALPRSETLRAAAGGFLALFAAPALVFFNRYSDVPSGSDVLFVTTAGWGLVTVVAGLLAARPAGWMRQWAAAVAGAVGGAAVLANWERPSSFSPFFRFPREEGLMLVGGVAWAAGSVLLTDVLRRADRRAVLPAAAAPAAAAAVLWALIADGPAGATSRLLAGVWVPQALAGGIAFVVWVALLEAEPPHRAGLWLMPVPALVSALALVEALVGMLGPRPLLVGPVLAGSAACLAAALWGDAPEPPPGTRPDPLASAFAWASLALAAASLAVPALGARIVADTGGAEYDVSWMMNGWETVGAWAALAVAFVALAAAFRPRSALVPTVVAVLLAAVLWAAGSTPLHTWNEWVPVEVQQDYGTEFARIDFGPWRPVFPVASVAFSGAGFAILLLRALPGRRRSRDARALSDTEVSS